MQKQVKYVKVPSNASFCVHFCVIVKVRILGRVIITVLGTINTTIKVVVKTQVFDFYRVRFGWLEHNSKGFCLFTLCIVNSWIVFDWFNKA